MTRNVGLICSTDNAKRYAENLQKFGYKIRALWTPDLEFSLQLAANCEIPFTANEPDEVLLRKDVEMLIVNCRPSLRTHVALSALGIGKHVVCASPLGLGSKESSALLEASKYYPQLMALVGYVGRLPEVYQKMRQIVKKGTLGWPIVCEFSLKCRPTCSSDRYDWTWEREEGGGVLNVLGSHVIDLLAYVLDMKATRVYGLMSNLRSTSPNLPIDSRIDLKHRSKSRAEDFVSFLMKFNDDACATVTLNSSPFACIGLGQTFVFEQIFVLCGPHGSMRAVNHDHLQIMTKLEEKVTVKSIDLDFSDEQKSFFGSENQRSNPYDDVLLATCFRLRDQGDEKPQIGKFASFQDANYVGAVIDAVIRSNYGGGWTKVENQAKNEDEDSSVV